MTTYRAVAHAHANIALAKYWGKADIQLNLPAVPSISITLAPLKTTTEVEFVEGLAQDEFLLDGSPAGEGELRRVALLLSWVRERIGIDLHARVASSNNFPTAAGLASSASGFCALTGAAFAAAGCPVEPALVSALSRRASASAARSVFGGFVELPAGQPGDADLAAHPLHPQDHWDVRVVVAVTAEGRKSVGSTAGMGRTEATSPYYAAWVESAPRLADQVREGLRARDLRAVGEAMEQSTLAMHACAMAAHPGLIYFQPASLAVMEAVRGLRRDGVAAYFTADAGPHVKVLCEASALPHVEAQLAATSGVLRTLVAHPGPGLRVEREGAVV